MTVYQLGERGDVVAFFSAMGVELQTNTLNASVTCFARPDLHRNGDRIRSCSVSVVTGAWKCWGGCGSSGGAYDAALVLGFSRIEAIDLMVRFGLTQRRGGACCSPSARRPAVGQPTAVPARRVPVAVSAARLETPEPKVPRVTESDVERWSKRLLSDHAEMELLRRTRGWSPTTVARLGIGLTPPLPARPAIGSKPPLPARPPRISMPFRDADGTLIGVQLYRPGDAAKAINVTGTSLGLFPHPAVDGASAAVILEGLSDSVCARSGGLPAYGVPGTDAWLDEWAWLFMGRDTYVLMDCDRAGRVARQTVARSLRGVARSTTILDLDPARDDRFDFTDWRVARPSDRITVAALLNACTVVPIEPAEATT